MGVGAFSKLDPEKGLKIIWYEDAHLRTPTNPELNKGKKRWKIQTRLSES